MDYNTANLEHYIIPNLILCREAAGFFFMALLASWVVSASDMTVNFVYKIECVGKPIMRVEQIQVRLS